MAVGALAGLLFGVTGSYLAMWIGAGIGCNIGLLVAEFTTLGVKS